MGTLLKFYKPLFSIRFSSFPNSLRSVQLRTHSFNNPKRRNPIRRCFSSLSPSSQPLINGTTLDKMDGNQQPGSPSSELWLHNTMSKKKELFMPKVEGKVGMYVCGVTAYDLSHIGHARVYADILSIWAMKFAMFGISSDVDDKIIARAKELAEDPISLSRRYCDEFIQDMVHLQCLPPSVEPRVSDHMPHIIDMIKQIVDNGYAYRVEGDVFFSVENFPEYGQLSGRKLEDNRAGERVAVDSRKRNPADFALWKASFMRNNVWINWELWVIDTQPTLLKSRMDQAAHGILNDRNPSAKEGEPFWESPWGPGRPGWHIECSAMSAAYLGYSFDIHGGGMDLVFPHHENEIAQSCAACKQSNVSYWIHNGFVTVDSEKMSKSLGNFFTIREVMDLYHPLALRLFLMGTHYRSPINYSDVLLESASERIFYIYQTLHDCENVLSQHDKGLQESIPPETLNVINKFHNDFSTSMSDDLHTPVALQQLREMALKRAKLTEDKILQKIEERSEARKNKDYEKSDAIRKDLAVVGIALMDSPDGTSWRPAIPLPLQEQQVAAT
ncbi:hypothetical protein GOBAR_DD00222 [Gossypium barbadense]|nr:hypothetical protein GOBAR_DD00222 [Gossypium barbadense]